MDSGIELKDYLSMIAKNWLIIVVTTVTAVLLAVVVTVTAEPVYESDMRLFVAESSSGSVERTSQDTFQGILISERLAGTYSQMVSRESFLERAADRADLQLSGRKLLSMVEARAIRDTQILAVSARGSTPENAANLANAVGELLVDEITALNTPSDGSPALSTVTLTVTDAARPADSPVSPRPMVNVIVGLIMGTLLGALMAFARDHFYPTTRDNNC